jgi:Fe-Mn family superoxide dismutase
VPVVLVRPKTQIVRASKEDAMTRFKLPPLGYDFGALEPHISAEIMELHHDKHHRAYVDGANVAIEKLAAARDKDDFTNIAAIERALAFNVSGHILHSIFWRNLSPKGGGDPKGALASAINRDFGNVATLRKQLNHAATTIMGSGWAALVWDPASRRLGTTQIHDHQSDVTQAGVPLLVMDAWEHAYYLQYKNRKADFFTALWALWNWDDVAARFERAQRADLALEDVVEDTSSSSSSGSSSSS